MTSALEFENIIKSNMSLLNIILIGLVFSAYFVGYAAGGKVAK